MSLDLRLAVPAAGAWLTAGLLVADTSLAAGIAAAGWTATAGAVLVALLLRRTRAGVPGDRRWPVRPRTFWRAVSAAAALTFACSAMVASAVAATRPLRELPAGPAPVVAVLEVTGPPVGSLSGTPSGVLAGRLRVPATITAISGPQGETAAAAPVLLFSDTGAAAVSAARIGTVLRAAVRLTAAEPGSDIAYLAFARGEVSVLRGPPPLLAAGSALRAGFAAAASALPGDGGALLPGLALGDTAAVGETLDRAMKTASLSHLTAVSGANCAIIVAGILLLGRALGLRRGLRVLLAAAFLTGFVVLVTPQPSVLRAALMAGVVLLTLATGRHAAAGIPALAVSVLVLLTVDPWLSRSYGFILSVFATAGLLLLAGPLSRRLAQWLPRWLAVLIAVPLSAQLVSQPVLLLLDASIALYGVPANLLTAPAAPVATVTGLIAALLLPFAPPLGNLAAQLAWFPAAWIAATAQFFARLPASRLPWLPGWTGLLALVLLTALLVGLCLAPRRFRGRGQLQLAAGLMLLGYLGTLGGQQLGRAMTQPADWTVASCDVGQGDATLVRSAGRVLLLDTGRRAAALQDCLSQLGVTRIDLLVLTHFDIDHVGAATELAGRVDTVLVGPSDGADADRLVSTLTAGGARVQQARRGDAGTLGTLRWRVLWPPAADSSSPPGNDSSVTLVTEDAGIRALFLGDLGKIGQAGILAAEVPSPVEIVKVAHHGSANQSPDLYAALAARIGLISVGAANDYGHPTDRALSLLRDAGTAIARTDRSGMLLIAPAADGQLRLWTERTGTAPAP